jgi:hypothetical protein
VGSKFCRLDIIENAADGSVTNQKIAQADAAWVVLSFQIVQKWRDKCICMGPAGGVEKVLVRVKVECARGG